VLIIVFTLSNLPIMVWMLYSGFKEIPPRSSRPRAWTAPRCGGVSPCAPPLAMGCMASTGLLCLVLSWNEAFWS
jgi:sorbitol/mannitol transport system permease protein